MSANLLDSATLTRGTKDDDGNFVLSKNEGKDNHNSPMWRIDGQPTLAENQTMHCACSVMPDEDWAAGSCWWTVQYADAAGNLNWVRGEFSSTAKAGTWTRLETTVVIPSGMRITYAGMNNWSALKPAGAKVANPCLSYGGPVTLASASESSVAIATARSAASAAASAKSTADAASKTASDAKTAASTASSNASNAVSTANAASKTASEAKTTAGTAATNASSAVTTANGASTTASEAKSAADAASKAVTALDTSLDQDGVFNRLTNNGQAQGLYLQNGKVYVNAEIIKSGTLASAKNAHTFWNLDTGKFACFDAKNTSGISLADGRMTLSNWAFFDSPQSSAEPKQYGLLWSDDAPFAIGMPSGVVLQGSEGVILTNNAAATGYLNHGTRTMTAPAGSYLQLSDRRTEIGSVGPVKISGGTSAQTYGVYRQPTITVGADVSGRAVSQTAGDKIALAADGGTVTIGDFACTGTKSAAVATSDGIRLLYALELADNRFGDMGEAATGDDCSATVAIDPMIAQVAETDGASYLVFVSPMSQGSVWVSARGAGSFEVGSDRPRVAFAWMLVAMRRGYKSERMRLTDMDWSVLDTQAEADLAARAQDALGSSR